MPIRRRRGGIGHERRHRAHPPGADRPSAGDRPDGRDGHPRRRPLYEGTIDQLGAVALAEELDEIRRSRPQADVLVPRPDREVLQATRPNPLSARAAVPAFFTTLTAMRSELARPGVWDVLKRHLLAPETG